MQKKILNIVELLVIGLILIGMFEFYQETSSTSRFSTESDWIRIIIDLIIVSTLFFRVIKIVKTYKKNYNELGSLKNSEKVVYISCLISLISDLSTWFQWYYFADLYLHILYIFIAPILLWTIEFVERVSLESNKLKNFMLSIIVSILPIIGYVLYLKNLS